MQRNLAGVSPLYVMPKARKVAYAAYTCTDTNTHVHVRAHRYPTLKQAAPVPFHLPMRTGHKASPRIVSRLSKGRALSEPALWPQPSADGSGASPRQSRTAQATANPLHQNAELWGLAGWQEVAQEVLALESVTGTALPYSLEVRAYIFLLRWDDLPYQSAAELLAC
jgi:hypothetical protein